MKININQGVKRTGILFFVLLFAIHFYAQNTESPTNSNYLIKYGISPKALDAALSSTLQEGYFKQNITVTRTHNFKTEQAKFQLIYDPSFKEGIDIQLLYDPDSLGYVQSKELLKFMETMHSFSRKSKSNLYDEASLKIREVNADTVILAYKYDPKKLEPELAYGKYLEGLIYIFNKTLVKVELKNTNKIKIRKGKVLPNKFKQEVYYEKDPTGGYVVSKYEQQYNEIKKRKEYLVTFNAHLVEYRNLDGKKLTLETTQSDLLAHNSNTETLIGSLGGALPLMGKSARKLGYHLPRPIGISVFNHNQSQTLQFTDLSIGFNSPDLVSIKELFNLQKSTVDQTTHITMVKGDVWLLPFLNIMGLVGHGVNTIDGSLFLSDELKETLVRLGYIVGIPADQIPDYLPIKSDLSSVTYGAGVTLAGGTEKINISLNYQVVFSSILEVNTTKVAHVFMPMVGYMTSFGTNLMIGAQGQYYNTVTDGYIGLPGDNRLDYEVDFEPVRYNLILGVYVPLTHHWDLAVQSGFGDRTSLTAVLGYRF
ncbi:hypothetical protein KFZ70_04505 [Tamlana fucoidanivorans]|uniref:Uncharacterized protein n=1 Tax=Allotamlana fucoidanivorans TaxID=2583814 RepID=A0A5C4SS21_9FLAO|nr:hypothetical protein [Tamlana fucoidanivorans]TNJ47216.1 hypothetical protein FGF67_01470 [Tamlana fucoidanivorans]